MTASLHGFDFLIIFAVIVGGSLVVGFLAAVVALVAAVLARTRAGQGAEVSPGRVVAIAIGLIVLLALPIGGCIYLYVAR